MNFIWSRVRIDCYLIEAECHFFKNTDPVRRTLLKFYIFIDLVIYCLESGVEKCKLITDGHVIHALIRSRNRDKRNITRSLVQKYIFYLILKTWNINLAQLSVQHA